VNKPLSKPKRRFFRVSLRTFLLLLTVGCVWLGWKVNKANKQRAAVAWVQKTGGQVWYNHQLDGADPPGPNWLRDRIGIDFLANVALVNCDGNYILTDVSPVRSLPLLRRLSLRNTPVSDLSPLASLMNLERLNLTDSHVTDLRPLTTSKNLEELLLSDSAVVDLTPLSSLTKLRRLDASNTPVTTLTPLANLTNLEALNLNDTLVSDVTPLAQLTKLVELQLRGTAVKDLTPLSHLASLERFDVSYTSVNDLTPLANLTNLKYLLSYGIQIDKDDLVMLQKALPDCQILTNLRGKND